MRNTNDAAERIVGMNADEIRMFAEHDPDIFRDVAKALINGREKLWSKQKDVDWYTVSEAVANSADVDGITPKALETEFASSGLLVLHEENVGQLLDICEVDVLRKALTKRWQECRDASVSPGHSHTECMSFGGRAGGLKEAIDMLEALSSSAGGGGNCTPGAKSLASAWAARLTDEANDTEHMEIEDWIMLVRHARDAFKKLASMLLAPPPDKDAQGSGIPISHRGIQTERLLPPAPHEWVAYRGDPDSAPDGRTWLRGYGNTDQDAIDDLLEQEIT